MEKKIIEKLIKKAIIASKNSYSPYSKYSVGAALLTKSGKIFTGTNVENSSYPAGVCAERTAIFTAVTAGEKEFDALAIFADGEKLPFPCGICRQVISEFSTDLPIIIARNKDDYVVKNISELLPHVFEFDLEKIN
ncbi:MAG: cytidine deaminase [Candidatus Cloacimonadota bacterium]|nr:cytidine deaminase [Candidatus Cloacimonadota bacterium]